MSKLVIGENDLMTVRPDIILEWNYEKNKPLTPSQVTVHSSRKVWWKYTKEGHEWQAVINNRTSLNRGCPICAGQKILSGYNDLATVSPRLAFEWHPEKNGDLSPSQVTAGSNKKVWWRCEKGHEWTAQIKNRIYKGNDCPICAGKTPLAGYNDLAFLYPKLASEWHPTKNKGLLPSQVTPGAVKKVWWQCPEGHEWETRISNRTYSKSGCPICSNKKRGRRKTSENT